MGSPAIFNGAFVKFLKKALRLGTLDADPTVATEGDIFVASDSHGTRNEGLYVYLDGSWCDVKSIAPTPTATHGYKACGATSGIIASATFDKFTISTETISNLTNFIAVRRNGGSCYDYGTKGWVLGGLTGGFTTRIDKVDFSTDVDSAIAATMSAAKDGNTGISSATKGYTVGGNAQTSINAIVHATELNTNLGTVTPAVRYLGCGAEDLIYGWVQNGVGQNTTYKFTFASETGANTGNTMSDAKFRASGSSDRSTKAFALGGEISGTPVASIEKLVYSTDVHSTIAATVDVNAPFAIPGIGDSTKGYHCIGVTNVAFNSMTTEIDDMDLVAETSAAITATVTTATGYGHGLHG